MKTALLVLTFLLCCAAALAAEDEDLIFDAQSARLKVVLSSGFALESAGSDASASYVKVNFTLAPKETEFQRVLSQRSQPKERSSSDSHILFEWQDPPIQEYDVIIESELEVQRSQVPITQKVPFPFSQPKDEDLGKYLLPSKNVDSDHPDIVRLASSLAAGEDDLYEVVYALAQWSKNNVAYNLSTLTADVSKPASWVLQERQGVCDELTNLFIALNRAVGIPARFVSGISYTNSPLFEERWGFHGWAEVYFPGHGWVPFDVTYDQMGFVDAGHIVLAKGTDVSQTSTGYQWRGHNIDLSAEKIGIQVITRDIVPPAQSSGLIIQTSALKDVVGFGSYNVEEAVIENQASHYVVAQLTHASTEGVTFLDNQSRTFLLGPSDKRYEYFTLKVEEGLREGFIYTFPLSLEVNGIKVQTSFKANALARSFELIDVERLKLPAEETDEKVYARRVAMRCLPHKEALYIYETLNLTCELRNEGNVILDGVRLCQGTLCEEISLGIGQTMVKSMQAAFTTPGKNRVWVTLSLPGEQGLLQSSTIEAQVWEEPQIVFEDLQFPDAVDFKERFKISFIARQNSSSPAQDVMITIEPSLRQQSQEQSAQDALGAFDVGKLEGRGNFSAILEGRSLQEGPNQLRIVARFKDENGKSYEHSRGFVLTLQPLKWWQRIERLFLRLLG